MKMPFARAAGISNRSWAAVIATPLNLGRIHAAHRLYLIIMCCWKARRVAAQPGGRRRGSRPAWGSEEVPAFSASMMSIELVELSAMGELRQSVPSRRPSLVILVALIQPRPVASRVQAQ